MKGDGKNKKCLAYVAIFIVFQIIVITAFALTVMKVKGPKVRFVTITADNFSSTGSNSDPSLSLNLVTEIAVKNTNFGHFKYQNSTVTIYYSGQAIGTADIPQGKAKARSTRRTGVIISINTDKLSGSTNLGSDINSGVVPLTSEATLKGKVELMKIIKKNKSGKMSCSMSLNLTNRAIQDLKCK
ncbi:late embryogenesis abundant protein At1g64065-like [Pyrus x bretschneideri]|uniref:late embryogenesis abundant protein At1g64065-like n=1 Tax=Pyrus x bretschneideri TaxID=225117 RepID=UPI00202EC792|nr:late embryogenesis abundant protein At1g64065-like [Pyrus x bretschneideri]